MHRNELRRFSGVTVRAQTQCAALRCPPHASQTEKAPGHLCSGSASWQEKGGAACERAEARSQEARRRRRHSAAWPQLGVPAATRPQASIVVKTAGQCRKRVSCSYNLFIVCRAKKMRHATLPCSSGINMTGSGGGMQRC